VLKEATLQTELHHALCVGRGANSYLLGVKSKYSSAYLYKTGIDNWGFLTHTAD
jgi:NRPS condensation-like uncharacterized protein